MKPSPVEHGLVDVWREGEDVSVGLDLLVEDHLGGDGRGVADALGHGRVGLVAVADQVDAALLAAAVGPADLDLWREGSGLEWVQSQVS